MTATNIGLHCDNPTVFGTAITDYYILSHQLFYSIIIVVGIMLIPLCLSAGCDVNNVLFKSKTPVKKSIVSRVYDVYDDPCMSPALEFE